MNKAKKLQYVADIPIFITVILKNVTYTKYLIFFVSKFGERSIDRTPNRTGQKNNRIISHKLTLQLIWTKSTTPSLIRKTNQ